MQEPLGSGWVAQRARLETATLVTLQGFAGEAEAMMKTEASWKDRSTLARQGLSGEAMLVQTGPLLARYALQLRHGQSYGKWLETVGGQAQGRRAGMTLTELERPEYAGDYAIIHPVVEDIGPGVVAAVVGLWSGQL